MYGPLALFLLGLLMLYRCAWVDANIIRWRAVCTLYQITAALDDALDGEPPGQDTRVKLTDEQSAFLITAVETWPRWHMLSRIWEWDFARYVVDQAARQKVLDFLAISGTIR